MATRRRATPPAGATVARTHLAGAVSVTDFGRHASAVLRSVRDDRQSVPISRQGTIVAVLQPTSIAGAIQAGIDFDDDSQVLPVRALAHGNPSVYVERAARGERLAITHHNRPIALLGPPSDWTEMTRFASGERLGDAQAPLTALRRQRLVPTQIEMRRADFDASIGVPGVEQWFEEHSGVDTSERRPEAEAT